MTISNSKKFLTSAGFVVLALSVGACAFNHDTYVSQSKVQLKEDRFYEEVPASDMDEGYISALAHQYRKFGGGQMDVSVAYDPRSEVDTAQKASNEVARITSALRQQGVSKINAGVLPVQGHGDQAVAIISYTSYEALAPKDCGTIPGYKSSNVDTDFDYKLGCTVETVFAKQVARPGDLKGQELEDDTTDGRRNANTVERYRTGIPNEPMEGLSASGE